MLDAKLNILYHTEKEMVLYCLLELLVRHGDLGTKQTVLLCSYYFLNVPIFNFLICKMKIQLTL